MIIPYQWEVIAPGCSVQRQVSLCCGCWGKAIRVRACESEELKADPWSITLCLHKFLCTPESVTGPRGCSTLSGLPTWKPEPGAHTFYTGDMGSLRRIGSQAYYGSDSLYSLPLGPRVSALLQTMDTQTWVLSWVVTSCLYRTKQGSLRPSEE